MGIRSAVLFMDTANRKLAACQGRPIGSKLLGYAANERLASRYLSRGNWAIREFSQLENIMVLSGGY